MPIDLNSAFSLSLFAFSIMTLLQLSSQFAGHLLLHTQKKPSMWLIAVRARSFPRTDRSFSTLKFSGLAVSEKVNE